MSIVQPNTIAAGDHRRRAWAEEVSRAIATLDPLHQRVLALIYFRSQTEDQIAAGTGLSIDAVRRVAAEGLSRLGEVLLQ